MQIDTKPAKPACYREGAGRGRIMEIVTENDELAYGAE